MKKPRTKLKTIYLVTFFIASCGTMPDSQNFEDGWTVIRNQCGDVSSKIRNKLSQVQHQREFTLFEINEKRIIRVNVKASRGNESIILRKYEKSESNSITETVKIRNARGLNQHFSDSIDEYYDSVGYSSELDMNCLLKGFRAGV